MSIKRSLMTLGLALTLAWILVSLPEFSFTAALAQSDTNEEPTGKPERQRAPGSEEYVHRKVEWVGTKSHSQKGVIPRSTSTGIANGDFENGQDGSWTEYSLQGWDIISNTLPVTPHSGSWGAWLGGDHDEVSYISQSVTVPADNSNLRFWWWILSEDVCGYDHGWVKVNSANVLTTDLCAPGNTGGWVAKNVDLGAYKGQTVTLELRVETDNSLFSSLYIDDVSFTAPVEESFTYIPITLKNYWSGYFEDFNAPHSGWPSGDNQYLRYGFLSGEYQMYLKRTGIGPAITPGPADGRDLFLPDDYRVEVDARKASAAAGPYGLRFGIGYTSDSFETYQVVVHPNSGEFLLEKRTIDGNWTTIVGWTYSSAINQGGGTNHIEVERVGSKIEIYMNSVEVANVTDGTLMGSGRDAGLVVYSWDDVPVDVRFDNFAASPP